MAVTSILMRRGAELATTYYDQPKPSAFTVVVFVLTLLLFVFATATIEYTYGHVVATLAAIEDPNPDIYVRIDDDPNKTLDPEAEPIASSGPITDKLATTIKHLRAKAGFWSRFRGLGMFMAYEFAGSLLVNILMYIIPGGSFLGQIIVQFIVGIMLATLQMAWVHIVITEPSPKRFYQRIPSWRSWSKIAPAAALQNFLTSAAFFLPLACAQMAGWADFNAIGGQTLKELYIVMAAFILPVLLAILISVPTRVIFIRVAASMLPEDDETIVPFDRSFGRKVQPEILGGSGKIGLLEAWRSFDWNSRIRFAKVIGKTLAMEMGLSFALLLILGVQLIILSAHKGKGSEQQI